MDPLYVAVVLKNWSVAVSDVMLNDVAAVCAVTEPVLPVPDVNVCPGNVTTSFATAPTTSVNVPKFVELEVTFARVAVPDVVRLPVAKGEPAVGLTRTFCHVNELVTPLAL